MYIALYARQSIEKEGSVSIETQFACCKACLLPDESEQPIRCFSDKGYSGKDTNRPEYQRLMQDVIWGRVSKIIVYKLDRVSRSIIDFADMLQTLKAHHVKFVSSQERFDTSSPYGEMLCKLLMVFAEFERTSIINRIRDAYEKRSDMGLYPGGRRVYGYDLEETVISGVRTKHFVPNPGEAAQIRCLFAYYAQPAVTLRSLQDHLLGQGITPLSGKGWTTAKLSSILRNPVYVRANADVYRYFASKNTRIIGDISDFDGIRPLQLYGRSRHDRSLSDWSDMKAVLLNSEGIVEADTWLTCQRKLERNRQVAGSTGNRTSWLGGKLVCGKCGNTMTTVKGASKCYFVCTGKSHKKTCTGIQTTIYAKDMERLADDCIRDKLNSLMDHWQEHTQTLETQRMTLRFQIKAMDHQISKLCDTAISSQMNAELISLLNLSAKRLSEEKHQLQNQLETLPKCFTSLRETFDIAECWHMASFQEKRAVCELLIKVIIISENGDLEFVWMI